MAKIVYNNCYGGFGLSKEGIELYAKLKGISPEILIGEGRYLKRDDPVLVQVVEQLGASADGEFGSLKIRELPSGTRYHIAEYDGKEEVLTPDEYDWSIA